MRKTKQTGITLVALVVTIVVLLILAGVSINLVLGENGLITQAKDAKDKTLEADETEGIEFAVTAARINSNGYDKLEQSNLQNAVDNQFGKKKATVIENGDGTFIIKTSDKEYYVSNSMDIIKLEKVNDKTPRILGW